MKNEATIQKPEVRSQKPDRLTPAAGFRLLVRRFCILHSAFCIFFACLGGGFVACTCVHGEPSVLVRPLPLPPPSPDSLTSEGGGLEGGEGHKTFPATNAVTAEPVQRALEEAELIALLRDTLQRDFVKTRGELELRLARPWTPRLVPDAPLTVKILELPNAGVTAACIVRFELLNGVRKLGELQAPIQAKVWREVWVARAPLKRGDNLADADLARERRDVINVREPLAEFTERDAALELAEPLQNGALLLARSVKLKTVIRRGQVAEALIEDGALRVTLKVEALEDGAPGQIIRARNPQTRRDLRGKVLNEQTIAVSL